MKKVSFMEERNRKGLGRCSCCGKTSYDHATAKLVAKAKRRREGTNHAEYRCPQNLGWHVGSSNGGVRIHRPTEFVRQPNLLRNPGKDAA